VRHDGVGPFEGVPRDAYFYFVHSFAPSECSDPCIATTDYGDKFASASAGKNVWAVQFHPEKSSDVGFRVVKNFVDFAGKRA
jgi:glutamine amidotransferase